MTFVSQSDGLLCFMSYQKVPEDTVPGGWDLGARQLHPSGV